MSDMHRLAWVSLLSTCASIACRPAASPAPVATPTAPTSMPAPMPEAPSPTPHERWVARSYIAAERIWVPDAAGAFPDVFDDGDLAQPHDLPRDATVMLSVRELCRHADALSRIQVLSLTLERDPPTASTYACLAQVSPDYLSIDAPLTPELLASVPSVRGLYVHSVVLSDALAQALRTHQHLSSVELVRASAPEMQFLRTTRPELENVSALLVSFGGPVTRETIAASLGPEPPPFEQRTFIDAKADAPQMSVVSLPAVEVARIWNTKRAPLPAMPRLTHLQIEDPGERPRAGQIMDPVKLAATSPRLRTLSLSGTGLGDEQLGDLSPLTSLRALELNDTQITGRRLGTELGKLPGLVKLDVSGSRSVDDAVVAGIAQLSHLQVLELVQSGVTQRGLPQLTNLPELRELGLCYLAIDRAVPSLAAMTKLRRLDLCKTKLSDRGLANLELPRELRGLGVHWTQITDVGLAHIARLVQLRYLRADHTRITDQGLDHVAKLVHLRMLDLSGNAITDAGLPKLYGLGELRTLELADTRVTAEGLAKLRAALPRTAVRGNTK